MLATLPLLSQAVGEPWAPAGRSPAHNGQCKTRRELAPRSGPALPDTEPVALRDVRRSAAEAELPVPSPDR
jgi:hypothetical protein